MRVPRILLILLLAVWAGILVGVSFLATPAKFLAPSLSMAAALDVGRHTFRVLAWTELGVAAAASLLSWRTGANSFLRSGMAVLWAIVLLERLWLLPELDQRVSVFLSGSPYGSSHHHFLFIACEAVKILVCLICSARLIAEFGIHNQSARRAIMGSTEAAR